MADPIAEAFVAVRADMSLFEADVQAGVTRALRGASIPSSAQQNLGQQLFGPGFFGAAKTKTTQALNETDVPTTTQQRFAQALFGPGFRNETGRAIQGALVGIGQGQLAARFAFFGAGGAAIAAVASGLLIAAQASGTFEQALNELQAVTNATDAEITQLSNLAKQLGSDINLPAVTAQTAANAMAELAKAGLDVDQVMGAIRGTLQLATAANIDAASAARIQASALNAFNLEGERATHVADLLAQASIESQASMQDLALALQQSAAVANLSGLSIEQLIASLTLLANRGLIGSDAGTSLRTALLRLIPTTRESAQFMEVLGIQIDRTRTLGEQLPDVLDQYNSALSRLNPTLRQAVLAQIAGQDAVRSLSFLIEGGGDELEAYTRRVDEAGAAQRLSEARTKGFLGALEGLNSQLQTLAINVGSLFTPALEGAIRSVTALIEPVNELFAALQKLDDIEINIDVNAPDLPGFDIPFLDRLEHLVPDVNLGRTIAAIFNPAVAQFTALEAKARALQAVLQALGLGATATEAEQLAEEARKLNEELFAPGTTRARRVQIQAEIAEIERSLKNLSTTAGQEGRKTSAALRDIIPFDALRSPLDQLEANVANAIDPNVLGRRLLLAIKQLQSGNLSDQAEEAARGLVASFIGQLDELGPEGERVLTNVGARLMDALGDGITREEGRAINAARAALQQVRAEGERQVQEAIRSARSNLETVGTSIADTLADVIDVGPLGQKIDEIEAELDRLQETVTRRQLRFDLTEAKQDLRDAQDAIAQVGQLTPEQKRSQEEFLKPFREKVLDAKAAAKEFDLTEQQKELEDTRDKAIEAADQGIQRLILRFEDGEISAGEFSTLLRRQLGPAFDIVGSKAAAALDPLLVRNFSREIAALIEQAQELSAFFPLGGATEPGAQVVRPSQTQQQVNQRIAESAASLSRIEADAKRLSDEEQEKQQTMIGILRQIARELGKGGPGSVDVRGGRPR